MKVFQAICASAALLLAASGAATPAARQSVGSLSWLSGRWVSDVDGKWMEEMWGTPRGGVMLGVNNNGRGDKAKEYEFLRIATDAAGNVDYWGSPEGATPVPFRLVSSGPNEAAFENPTHDYPVRIAYRRTGSLLTATISGPGGSRPMSWRLRRAER